MSSQQLPSNVPILKKKAEIRIFAMEIFATDDNLRTQIHWDDDYSAAITPGKRERVFMVAVQQLLKAALTILGQPPPTPTPGAES